MSGLLSSFKQFCTDIPSLTAAQVQHLKADPTHEEFFAQFAGTSRATRYLFRTLLRGLGAQDSALRALFGGRAVGRPRKAAAKQIEPAEEPIPAGGVDEPATDPAAASSSRQDSSGSAVSLLSVTGDSIRSLLDLFLDLAAGVDSSQKAQHAHALLGVLRERLAHAEP